jgi:hypothetical protein
VSESRKAVLAANLRRLVPRPWKRFAERLELNPKNLYAYLRAKKPKAPPSPVLAAIARELHVSMDDLLASQPALPPSAVPILGRAAAGRLPPVEAALADPPRPDASAPQAIRVDLGDVVVTIRVERRG